MMEHISINLLIPNLGFIFRLKAFLKIQGANFISQRYKHSLLSFMYPSNYTVKICKMLPPCLPSQFRHLEKNRIRSAYHSKIKWRVIVSNLIYIQRWRRKCRVCILLSLSISKTYRVSQYFGWLSWWLGNLLL